MLLGKYIEILGESIYDISIIQKMPNRDEKNIHGLTVKITQIFCKCI